MKRSYWEEERTAHERPTIFRPFSRSSHLSGSNSIFSTCILILSRFRSETFSPEQLIETLRGLGAADKHILLAHTGTNKEKSKNLCMVIITIVKFLYHFPERLGPDFITLTHNVVNVPHVFGLLRKQNSVAFPRLGLNFLLQDFHGSNLVCNGPQWNKKT